MALLKDLTVFGASRFVLDIIANNIYSNGYHHSDHNNDDAVLLAGGGWETITNLLGTGYWADQPVTSLGSTTTEPTFGKVTVNGSVGIGTDANVNYRLYVSGKSMFTNTLNIDSNSIGTAGAHINFNRANFNYINIPTNGTLAVCINGVGGANTFLAIDSAAVYPGYHNNSVTLGTTSYKWSKVYIGANASYGGTTQPIYWNDGVPTATLYSLSASIAAGAANRMAYYSGINAITYASSIYATTTALAINSTSITSGYNFQVLGSSLLRLIAPQTTNTYDIGSTSLRWKSMYNVEEYIGTDSGSQCHLNFDNTNKCLRFTFD